MPDPAWAVYFYRSPDGALPGEDFFDRCPIQVEAHFSRLLQAVAAGPPPAFPGSGYWPAMHGDLADLLRIAEVWQTAIRSRRQLPIVLRSSQPAGRKGPGPASGSSSPARRPVSVGPVGSGRAQAEGSAGRSTRN